MRIEFDICSFGFCLMVNFFDIRLNERRTLVGLYWKSKRWIYPDPIQWYTA